MRQLYADRADIERQSSDHLNAHSAAPSPSWGPDLRNAICLQIRPRPSLRTLRDGAVPALQFSVQSLEARRRAAGAVSRALHLQLCRNAVAAYEGTRRRDAGAAVTELERLVLAADGVVLRYGRLFGPRHLVGREKPEPPRRQLMTSLNGLVCRRTPIFGIHTLTRIPS
jgi:hypothetical protein